MAEKSTFARRVRASGMVIASALPIVAYRLRPRTMRERK